MKKARRYAFSLTWIGCLILSLFCFTIVGCSSSSDEQLSYQSAQELLEAIWEKDSNQEDFTVGGYGNENNISQNKPGPISLEHSEEIAVAFSIPQRLVDSAQNAASIMNRIMPNYFTASVWQLEKEVDGNDLMNKVAQHLEQNPWIDAFPDKYAVYWADPFIVVCYGLEEPFDSFSKACEEILTIPGNASVTGSITSTQ